MVEKTNNQSNFFTWMERNARTVPDKLAISSIDQNKDISHGELFKIANQIGQYYENKGIGRNDRVVLLSNNSIEHLIIYLASLAYGCTICTVNVEMNARYLSKIIESLNAKTIFFEPESVTIDQQNQNISKDQHNIGEWSKNGSSGIFSQFEKHKTSVGNWPLAKRTDDISIFYTSGTSSNPKGVVCSYAELYDNTTPISDAFGLTSKDRILDCRSMNWMSAQVLSAIGPVAKGSSLLLGRKFSASSFFDWINDYEATVAVGNPTIINMLVNRERSRGHKAAPNLRYITSSSAPLLVSEWKRFEETFNIQICQGYGASEVGWISGSHEQSRRLGSVGRPVKYQQVAIVDNEGNALGRNQIGAIQLNGNPAGRYRYLDEKGKVVINGEGSILTGDMGYIDEDGFLFVTGREKDLIIRGGVNISPLEIDNVILQIPEVLEVATVGVPDEVYGERVVVYIVAKKSHCPIEDTVLTFCQQNLPDFKVPGEIIFKDTLPKTKRGKMDRNALAQEWKKENIPN